MNNPIRNKSNEEKNWLIAVSQLHRSSAIGHLTDWTSIVL